VDSPDEVNEDIILISCWVISEPEYMRKAFDALLNKVINDAEGVVDWGSMVLKTTRAIHPDTAQELHLFSLGVREIK
jgi:hypothetical protein